ncbi:hypothetical protein HanLR1_Chr05g0178671 [Helianthus annuus]|nr:hypothetical protein HanHA89_Chr05g0189161 [Helianthus annuus]KAJ0750157.1 hypothetical protein HanLR1_Chr05g0178671 [Helianthus annuus]
MNTSYLIYPSLTNNQPPTPTITIATLPLDRRTNTHLAPSSSTHHSPPTSSSTTITQPSTITIFSIKHHPNLKPHLHDTLPDPSSADEHPALDVPADWSIALFRSLLNSNRSQLTSPKMHSTFKKGSHVLSE